MAPEQVLGQQVTTQVDVYSFGVLLYEMIVGLKPVSGETVEKIFSAILYESLNLEPLRAAQVPESVYNLIAACTAKNPSERPAGFGIVCAELDRILQNPSASGKSAIKVSTSHASGDLPGFMKMLPAPLQTPTGLIIIVGVGVLLILTLIGLIAIKILNK
jgi:serine/threonine protein kinase